jgi:hypothetical protein
MYPVVYNLLSPVAQIFMPLADYYRMIEKLEGTAL